MRIFQWFPTAVALFDMVEKLEPHLHDLITAIGAWQAEDPEGVQISNRKGVWHSPTNAHLKKELAHLNNLVLDAGTELFKTMKYKRCSCRLHNMWVNVSSTGGWHAPHTHGDSLWSGVLYLQAPEGSGPIVFTDPRVQAVDHAAYSVCPPPNSHIIKPEVGKLLLFPGWLTHYVEPSEAGTTRISVSFNLGQVLKPRPAASEEDH